MLRVALGEKVRDQTLHAHRHGFDFALEVIVRNETGRRHRETNDRRVERLGDPAGHGNRIAPARATAEVREDADQSGQRSEQSEQGRHTGRHFQHGHTALHAYDLVARTHLHGFDIFLPRPVEVLQADCDDAAERRIALAGQRGNALERIARLQSDHRLLEFGGHDQPLAQGKPAQQDHRAGADGKQQEENHERSTMREKIKCSLESFHRFSW